MAKSRAYGFATPVSSTLWRRDIKDVLYGQAILPNSETGCSSALACALSPRFPRTGIAEPTVRLNLRLRLRREADGVDLVQ